MKYFPLAKFKYVTHSDEDPRIVTEKEYQQRLNSYTTQKTALFPLLTYRSEEQTSEYPIFFLPLPHILDLAEQFRLNSKRIQKIAGHLPPIAISQFLNSLLIAEIFYTNEIEGVKTSQIEIGTVIQENNLIAHRQNNVSKRRLGSTIKLYQKTQHGKPIHISSLHDFRAIYDILLKGEITADRLPNGQIFRDQLPNGEALTISSATKVVHRPPASESKIQQALTTLITFMNDDYMPALFKTLITHFFFENTHPFLDGNGRMGRYLLSSYISSKFDRFTGFSVATAIHANVQHYYKAFIEADNAENRADLTFFIESLLDILVSQQQENLVNLRQSMAELDNAKQKIRQWIEHHQAHFPERTSPELVGQVLFSLAQSKLFSYQTVLGIRDNEIIDNNKQKGFAKAQTRRAIDYLTTMNAIKLTSAKPKQHEILIV